MSLWKILDEKLEEFILVPSLAFTASLTFLQVIMRYVFGHSLSWSEELSRYIFVWQIWLGTSFAVKESRHIRIEMLRNALSAKWQQYLDILVFGIWIAFCVFVVYRSSALVAILMQRGQVSSALRIPMQYAYISVPVGCGLMTFRLFQKLFLTIRKTEGV